MNPICGSSGLSGHLQASITSPTGPPSTAGLTTAVTSQPGEPQYRGPHGLQGLGCRDGDGVWTSNFQGHGSPLHPLSFPTLEHLDPVSLLVPGCDFTRHLHGTLKELSEGT